MTRLLFKLSISLRKEAFDKIAREARENGKKARSTAPFKQGQHSKGQAYLGHSSTNQSQTQFSYPICSTCNKKHLGQCLLGQRGCDHYYDLGHLMKDCPQLKHAPGKDLATQVAPTSNSLVAPSPVRAPNAQTGRGANRGGSQGGGGLAKFYAVQD
ncbi:PREDICTED: uncharacterized protein LOC109205258 [Nicotiana attenuata]|uniref:uncharacterized protein LOC109205258 n=1 Tax=Nicotiana attenuata TaxID=49451 RepID=UPI0009047463|nr:PREDICTED: uncharacterized protein LOC109205258 [Nicotiana attenuata]